MDTTARQLGNATARWDGQRLYLSTGEAERTYERAAGGLRTISLRDAAGREWIDAEAASGLRADWYVLALTEADASADLVDLAITRVDEDRWTSPHLLADARFAYSSLIELTLRVWVYPDAPGFRSQIGLLWTGERERPAAPSYLGGSWGESLCLNLPAEGCERLAAGYYNDTQHRNNDDTPLLLEERALGRLGVREIYDRANLLRLTTPSSGLSLVKESHQCANQPGIDTGAFLLESGRVRVTGIGVSHRDWALDETTTFGWPSWVLTHGPEPSAASLAVKRFDRLRFPVKPERDYFVMANTWGSRGAGAPSRSAATEENLLRELESCAELGIDVLQCDDGWQCPPGDPDRPFDVDWLPDVERFPRGWGPVRDRARELGVKLGLWAPWFADFDALRQNVEEGEFAYLKLDFVNLSDKATLDSLLDRARRLIENAPGDLRVNWDVTENAARVGYFVGREFGSIYLENRETGDPPLRRLVHIRYTPRLTLRDAWQLSHHLNLNQFQVTVQNKDMVVPDLSNCREYSHAYNAAIPLMALPIYFQETHFLSEEAREQIRPILAAWHEQVERMHRGYVFPLGSEPNDHSWTGFQAHDPTDGSGYVLLFREIYNTEQSAELPLALGGDGIRSCRRLLSGGPDGVDSDGRTSHLQIGVRGGMVKAGLEQPGSFVWFTYEAEGV
jgi:hypothetical protein